jgi:hypothetical protein
MCNVKTAQVTYSQYCGKSLLHGDILLAIVLSFLCA